ncbi:protein lethal(2)essential for life-like [Agrilus planipennis]|uniref:Protein lethal(2)essential for life-like n=1 Tax=Agrilus planipennis TaxID=224129 RepID=A0A1W4WB10_AGRPL|nr:protein lethal(2)essential for life-like [Agrilus planipennis]
MSLLPYFLNDPWDNLLRPSRLLDQHFGVELDPEDLLAPMTLSRPVKNLISGYLRPWRTLAADKDLGSTVKFDKDKYEVSLDVQQFKPDEIKVTAGQNSITIEGNHEEKEENGGTVSRHFVRRYVLPRGLELEKVESKMSSDGVLQITVPRKEALEGDEKVVPIQQTGQPAKAVEDKSKSKEKKKK